MKEGFNHNHVNRVQKGRINKQAGIQQHLVIDLKHHDRYTPYSSNKGHHANQCENHLEVMQRLH